MLKQSYFLIMIKVADDAIQRSYLKEDLDWNHTGYQKICI